MKQLDRKNIQHFRQGRWLTPLALILVLAMPALASAPDWVSSLRALPIGEYGPEIPAVCLLEEVRTKATVRGEIRSHYRMAYRILTREGLDRAWVRLDLDAETKATDLEAWNLKDNGVIHEVRKKDAVEAQLSGYEGVLYEDDRSLVMFIPRVEVGSIIAYEYEQTHRPDVLQDEFWFHQSIPVLRSRFELELPDGWELRHRTVNHPRLEPASGGGNRWVWQLQDLPGIRAETNMPPMADVAARLVVSYFPNDESNGLGQAFRTWDDVAAWFSELIGERAEPSPDIAEMSRKVAAPEELAKFVQEQIRYVAIAIGIGGYQPHAAAHTFGNRYGDCKDKVTLFRALRRAQGLETYPVLIHADGRSLVREFPSPLQFNHMIAAVPVSSDGPPSPAMIDHPELGRLILFDPTDSETTFRNLPSALQGTTALLIDGARAHLIETPVTAPAYNSMTSSGSFDLSADGKLRGEMTEMFLGELAAEQREWLGETTQRQWISDAEEVFAERMPGVRVSTLRVGVRNASLAIVKYELEAPRAVEVAGDLLILRPAILSEGVRQLSDSRPRSCDYRFGRLSVRTMTFQFEIPDGYVVDSLPEAQEIEMPFARYRWEVTKDGDSLVFRSVRSIEALTVPANEIAQLREYLEFVERVSQSVVLLKKSS